MVADANLGIPNMNRMADVHFLEVPFPFQLLLVPERINRNIIKRFKVGKHKKQKGLQDKPWSCGPLP